MFQFPVEKENKNYANISKHSHFLKFKMHFIRKLPEEYETSMEYIYI